MRAYVLPVALLAAALSACGSTSTVRTTPSVASVVDLTGSTSIQVQAASHTIACGFDTFDAKASVRCDVQGHWNVTTPTTCHGGYGDSVELGAYVAPLLGCHTDTVFVTGARVIPNGTAVRYAQLTCVFAASGVTCTNGANERFAVSPSRYTFG